MLNLNFNNPFPVIETPRLMLRRVAVEDAEQIFALRSHPETMRYIPRPLVKSTEEALEHFRMIDAKIENNEGINWAITLKNDPMLIGIIGHYRIQNENQRSEIGYMLLPEFHRQGITNEAIQAILVYGFETMHLHSVEAIIDPRNIASEKVLLKNNFTKEAHILENEYFDGKFWDTVIYSLLKRNFK
ncbi:GNAT family N-acetyltransferase [Flavobacterium sp. CYK-4]|uniref:GNAT family N-acetyltransferase n=1 Tax=Flavobacterium lotistagni TaxID=2709660 RepID=UPI001407B81F|nr:GNAT family N-acetyltransferase [Flavobacterium lotistagni]NHM06988.1 GNAT family N-acetyltransferase [Flavobacterium lotistagni]